MRKTMTAAAMVVGLAVSVASAGVDRELLIGNYKWRLASEVAMGKPTAPTDVWATLSFSATRVDFPNGRSLRYSVDKDKDPHTMTIWNEVGDAKVTVYSAVYKVEGDKLTITFNAGDTMPTSLKSGENDVTTELHFVKAR